MCHMAPPPPATPPLRGNLHVARAHIWLRHAAVNPWCLKNQATVVIHQHLPAANPAVFLSVFWEVGAKPRLQQPATWLSLHTAPHLGSSPARKPPQS